MLVASLVLSTTAEPLLLLCVFDLLEMVPTVTGLLEILRTGTSRDMLPLLLETFHVLEMVPTGISLLLDMELNEGPISSNPHKHNQVAETKEPLVNMSASCFLVLTYLINIHMSFRIRS